MSSCHHELASKFEHDYSVNNGELDSFYEIPDDWHEIASIDYNVIHVDIVNTIRIMNCSGSEFENKCWRVVASSG